jgi:hypothetical protein
MTTITNIQDLRELARRRIPRAIFDYLRARQRLYARGRAFARGRNLGPQGDLPLHGATFDIRTGEVLGPPADEAVARYAVRVTGTDIEVEL